MAFAFQSGQSTNDRPESIASRQRESYWNYIRRTQTSAALRPGTANFAGSEGFGSTVNGRRVGTMLSGVNGPLGVSRPPPTTSAAAAIMGGYLPAPPVGALVDAKALSLPSVAEADFAPDLLGEQGGVIANPQATFAKQQYADLTAANPLSVAPSSMGLDKPNNRMQQAAVAVTQHPDVGMAAATLERDKQQVDQAGAQATTAAENATSNVAAEQVVQSGRTAQRRRGGGRAGRGRGTPAAVPSASTADALKAAAPAGGQSGGTTLATNLFRT